MTVAARDVDFPAATQGVKQPPVDLVCPEHRDILSFAQNEGSLRCAAGCRFVIERDIPRFVPRENYASGFGLQWNAFRTTQLDSHTGTRISADRLQRIAGGDLRLFNGKRVLEAGCGAGRFTEVMLQSGATVFAVDLSNAVEANMENCGDSPNHFVCQADITRLPVPPATFDVVVCVGVIQHTPDPEATMSALCGYLRPGGILLIDHYGPDYAVTPSRQALRRFLLSRSPAFALQFCRALVLVLWPIHRLSFALRKVAGGGVLRRAWLRLSPVVDYQDAYAQLGTKLLFQWAVLDTHDTVTDRYKHLRSTEQIRHHLHALGMVDIAVAPAGNGVEARATKPAARVSAIGT